MQDKFSAQPQVQKVKKKYRDQDEEEVVTQNFLISKFKMKNLMFDKRVVRGSTYAAIITTSSVQPMAKTQTYKIPKQQALQQAQDEIQGIDAAGKRRCNIQIFTDQHVESMTDKPPRYEKDIQTDFQIEKIIVRHLIKPKTGQDIQTQIQDEQLFNFDYEVDPLLNVLVGRILEESRCQVLQQEQLQSMKNKQKWVLQQESLEQQKIKNMQDNQLKLQEENQRMKEKYRKEKEKNIETHKKLLCRSIAKSYLSEIKKNSLNKLEEQGAFLQQLTYEYYSDFIPELYRETLVHQQNFKLLQMELRIWWQEIKLHKKNEHLKRIEEQKERRRIIIMEREEKKRQKEQREVMRLQFQRSIAAQIRRQEKQLQQLCTSNQTEKQNIQLSNEPGQQQS